MLEGLFNVLKMCFILHGFWLPWDTHYNDVIMGVIMSQITNITIVYSIVYSDADQRKHKMSALLAFAWGIHWGQVNSPHKWPVRRKMFPFDDVIMWSMSISMVVADVVAHIWHRAINSHHVSWPEWMVRYVESPFSEASTLWVAWCIVSAMRSTVLFCYGLVHMP